MREFSSLFRKIEQTNSTNAKVDALVNFFEEAPDSDKLWAIALFTHRRPKRTISTSFLRQWAAEMAKVPDWLFEDSYHIVGDLAETISLILPNPIETVNLPLSTWIEEMIELKTCTEEDKKEWITQAWKKLSQDDRFLLNKLITGGFRIGVSQRLITKALARNLDVEESKIAHRLMGNWSPLESTFEDLMLSEDYKDLISRPYPFYLAYAIDKDLLELGPTSDWQVEWKWDGIRGQFIYRNGEIFIWSRGEELVTDRFPELHSIVKGVDYDFVIDGEILAFADDMPLPFQDLQKRIGRKTVSKNLLKNCPVIFMAYDILEFQGEDIRYRTMSERRERLEKLNELCQSDHFRLSETILFSDWNMLNDLMKQARSLKTEGFMLKKKGSPYRDGRKKGDWWKWKVEPYTIDAVMTYAQRGHGRRANLFTDFTFGLWEGERLVTFAKAYSGLTDEEFLEITRFVRKNTIERFGPVHSVIAELVFEIAFEGIQESKRHKSGIALRFPRIHRWRKDKKPSEANTLDDIKLLLDS